jgi:glycerophosphoryl diester phosphodiesterase
VPEHSLEAYRLASNLHSHYIELDLALTRDGVFVAMHDLLLDSTTDVAE